MAAPVRVLHVDDEPHFADLTATLLEREADGLTVETVTSTGDGLDRLESGAVDCVVSEYEMPGMDGIEFLERVRERDPDLPFVLFTGTGSEEVASEAISAGVTDYLRKEDGTDQYVLLANKVTNAVEHARAERAHQRHLEAIETAREGISILDEDGEFIYVNERYAELYGYEPGEMLGEHWELVYPDDRVSVVRTEILPTVAEDGYWRGETTGQRADGSTFREDHAVSRTASGDLVCTVRDLTDTREREAELHRMTRAMDEAPIGITITDPAKEDNPIIYVNDEFLELTGYAEEEVLGRNCRFLQGENTREEPVATLREAIDDEERATVELRNYRTDGTEFWNRVSVAPVRNESGEVVNHVGFQRDVTRHKERERELAEVKRRLDLALQEARVGIWEWHIDTGDLYWSDELLELLGLSREEFDGSIDIFEERLHPDDVEHVEEAIEEAITTGEQYRVEQRLADENGEYHWLDIRGQVIDEAERTYMVGLGIDITDRKEQERQLEHQNERLDQFTSLVSHDLRNPLNVAQGRLALAREECDSDHLDDVARAHDRMSALIENLLLVARHGDRIRDSAPVDLEAVAETGWNSVETNAATLTTETDRTIRADRNGLQQLFENLMRNAVEHGGSDVRVRVGAFEDGFYVEDDGPGIPADERGEVFEAGYSTTRDGTGLGLLIVTQVADAHGWGVRVTDGTDGGARFEVTDVDFVP